MQIRVRSFPFKWLEIVTTFHRGAHGTLRLNIETLADIYMIITTLVCFFDL